MFCGDSQNRAVLRIAAKRGNVASPIKVFLMNDHVHVFVGCFKNREAACEYSEPQWEAEPDVSSSDQEYAAWEQRNPSWQLRTDLGVVYLDSDFIETIDGDDRYEYLSKMLTQCGAIDRICKMAEDNENTLVLVFSEALGGFKATVMSTPKLKYCGQFSCKL